MRPYLRVANVYEDRIETSDVLEMNFTPEEFQRYALRRGDILLNEGQSLELVGRAAMYRDEVPGACFQNTLLRYRVGPSLDSRFALLQFLWFLHSQRFKKIASWTTSIAHLGSTRFAAMVLALPPKAEQHRIVDEVEKQFTRLDAAVAGLQRVKANLKRYRASVLKAACEGRLVPTEAELARREGRSFESGEELLKRVRGCRAEDPSAETDRLSCSVALADVVPDGWTLAMVEELGASGEQPVLTGPFGTQLSRATFVTGGVPVLTIGCLTESGLDLAKAVSVGSADAERLVRYRLREGDILFSRMASVGRAGLVPARLAGALINYHLMRLRLDVSVVDPRYFIAFVRGAGSVIRYLRDVNHGATRDGINTTQLLTLRVALPPLHEQRRIVAEVERRLSVVEELEATVEKNLARCARLRQSILKMAFQGRLVPQDPNDEPARVLLERIRRERDSAKVAGPPPPRRKAAEW